MVSYKPMYLNNLRTFACRLAHYRTVLYEDFGHWIYGSMFFKVTGKPDLCLVVGLASFTPISLVPLGREYGREPRGEITT